MVSFFENGRALPDYEMIEKMAEALNCTVGDLYRPAMLDLIRRAS
jgi:transcriptional regulator with XRE-family HTH domain